MAMPSSCCRTAIHRHLPCALLPAVLAANLGAADSTANPAPAGASTQPVFRVAAPHPTTDKPQSKLWFAHGAWWALLPDASGPSLWERRTAGWIEHPEVTRALAGLPGRADVWFDRDGVLAACVGEKSIAIIALRPVEQPAFGWRAQKLARWETSSTEPVETATLARDGAGRWWVAAPVTHALTEPAPTDRPAHAANRDVLVWTSLDAIHWTLLPPLARNVSDDDICAVTPVPDGIGVAWSDQIRDEVGFSVHVDSAAPDSWQNAVGVDAGHKTADDHLHAALGADGVLWLATKNSLDAANQPQLVLRVRAASGTWRNFPYAPRLPGIEPSRPVTIATPNPRLVLLGHTIYDRRAPFAGTIVFGRIDLGAQDIVVDPVPVIAPAPGLKARINDITAPKAAFPADGPWIVLASDAEGRVYEADLRRSVAAQAAP